MFEMQIIQHTPQQMFETAPWAARTGLPISAPYPTPLSTPLAAHKIGLLDVVLQDGVASYESLDNVEIDDPDNSRKAKIEDALELLADWGWSHTVKKINTIQTAINCNEQLMKIGNATGMAPWFDPSIVVWEPTFMGLRFCFILETKLLDLLWRWPFQKPQPFRLILLRRDIVEERSTGAIADLILHEARHHEYYPYFGICFKCAADHYGIDVALRVSTYIKDDPTHVINLAPMIDGDPPQERLDAVEQLLAYWGLGGWVANVVPDDYFDYVPDDGIFSEKSLNAGDSDTLWVIKIVSASLDLTISWLTPGQIPDTRDARNQAKDRAFLALLSRINRVEWTYVKVAYQALQSRFGLG